MKTSTLTLAVAALFALGACSSADSEPTATKTVTESPSDADAEPAYGDAEGDVDPDDLPELPTFESTADAYGTFEDGYIDTEDKDADWSCSGGGAEEEGIRDPDTGEVFDAESETCWLAKTSEPLTITVVDGEPQEVMSAVMTICEEYDPCFPGDGWAVVTDNDAMMPDVLEGLGVDSDLWVG